MKCRNCPALSVSAICKKFICSLDKEGISNGENCKLRSKKIIELLDLKNNLDHNKK